ncbi:peptide-methionine (S)-S-oxide reductase MsrA [Candidatus Dojkabacteria bacterium]|nr:peptide-methionine (S)-S-oxide reductase MsrA [Candidatus Dojkabacteria bacterium]
MPFLHTKRNIEKPQNLKSAYFAGGCFWCVESDFDKLANEGIYEVTSGYAGGSLENPTYENHGDHLESVEVKYDADKISFKTLTEYFFRHIDPTDEGGQFYDRGHAYTTAIFYQSEEEKQTAKLIIFELEQSKKFTKPIATKLIPYINFYPAEDYHQKYYKKDPLRYKAYRIGSGRDKFTEEHWN